MADEEITTETDTSGRSSLLVLQTAGSEDDLLERPLSYIHLGTSPAWGTSSQRGDDLLLRIGIDESTHYFFADDHRSANAQSGPSTTYTRDDGNVSVGATPEELTAELMTRGGIRVHSDGNYISTTRGDRVDVIGGNYQLAVLGRTDGSSTDSVWRPVVIESSGGHAFANDATLRDRITSVTWDPAEESFRVVRETLKGNQCVRFQGPLETVFECSSITETIGRNIDDDDTTLPASAGPPHQQTDAGTHWINPSVGPGSDFPREKRDPDVRETLRATSVTENVECRATLGGSGVMTSEHIIDGSDDLNIFAEGSKIEHVFLGDNDAHVSETVGFDTALMSTSSAASSVSEVWRALLSLGIYEGAAFAKRQVTVQGGSTWLGEVTFDLVAVRTSASFGARLIATDVSRVTQFALFNEATYGKAVVANERTALLAGATLVMFGSSDTVVKIGVPTTEVRVARASVCVSPFKARVSVDHIMAHLIGTFTEIGIGKAQAVASDTLAVGVRTDGDVVNISMNGLKVKS